GINPRHVWLRDMTPEFWDSMFAIHLKGPLRLGQLVAPRMRDTGGGSVINISSTGAYRATAGISAYTPSKLALVALTRSMAVEWARYGVRVNCISPGAFRTEIMERAERRAPGLLERAATASPLGRIGEPDELVGAVIYLASDASSYVTGEDHLVA